MKNNYKVFWETWEKETCYCFYESTSIPALISYLSDNGFGVGSIVKIERVSRLPKVAVALKGCYE